MSKPEFRTIDTNGIKLRAALEIRHRTGNPLALVENGRVVGVIGDDEIYRGILRQTGVAG